MYCNSKVNEKKKCILVTCFILVMMFSMAVVAAEQSPIGEGEKIPVFNCEEDFGVRKALALLGDLCGRNIVPSPSVDGQLAFQSLKDVTFEEAMDAILGDGFVYAKEGNLIKVYTKTEYESIMNDPKRRVHKVITLYYITAEEAVKLITPVLSDSAIIQSSSAAEKTISGSTGGSSGGSGGGSLGSGGGGDSLALNDTIVVYDFPEKITLAEEIIKDLDVKPRQVLVEATILSALLDEDMTLGIDWNLLSGYEVSGFAPALATTIGTPIETTGFAFLDDGLRIGISSDRLQGFISALETITDVTVMANPQIMAVNKQQGSLLIGKKLGYLSSQTVTDGGTSTSQVDFFQSGTMLVFRPYIGNDGYIRMEIFPKDSSAELNATTQAPDETTTELQTNILVKDGETIIIGGLFRDVVSTVRQQVPILGNLPIIGALFSGQTDLTQREEVIVMLTPHIIEDPVESSDTMVDVKRKQLGANDELIPFSRRKMAEDHYSVAAQCYLEGDMWGAMKHLDTALNLRPSYLEAINLKERILSETDPDAFGELERNVLDVVEE